MLAVCVGQKIPDIPKGRNRNAGVNTWYLKIRLNIPFTGKPFTKNRSKKMHLAFARAGCAMPKLESLGKTAAPTLLSTPSPTVHVSVLLSACGCGRKYATDAHRSPKQTLLNVAPCCPLPAFPPRQTRHQSSEFTIMVSLEIPAL
jgi:hypothetical protein